MPRHDVFLHLEQDLTVLLRSIVTRLRVLETQGKQLLMASAEMKAALQKIDVATDNIAADLVRLKDNIKPGMTDAEVAEVQAILDSAASKLEGVAASTEDPV